MATRDPFPEWATWMRERGYAPTTMRLYQQIVRRWKRTRKPAKEWLLDVEQASRKKTGLPTETSRVYRRALLTWHEWEGTPVDLALPRVVRFSHPRPAAVLPADLDEVLLGAIAELAEPVSSALTLMFHTGMRSNEAATARLDGLHARGGGLTLVVKAKGGVGAFRTVVVPTDAARALAAYLRGWRAAQPGPWLFPRPRDPSRPLAHHMLYGACEKLSARIGTRVHPHALRHVFATRLAEAGVGTPLVAAAMGHTVAGMTGRYQHPGTDAIADAIERARR